MRRLYVLVRADIARSYQAVQAGHAVAQFMLDNPTSEWKNDFLIYLSVADELALKDWKWKLESLNHQVSVFRELDINNEMTAIAIECDGKALKKLKLL